MKKVLIFFILSFTTILAAKDKMEFFLDYSTFQRSEGEEASVELYFSVPVKNLKYDDSLKACFSVNVKVYDGEKLIASDYFGQYSFISSEKEQYSGGEAPAQTLFDLKPGKYRLRASVVDLASKDSALIDIPQSSGKFLVKSSDKNMGISGVQLSSKIVKVVKPGTEFVKGGIMVLPNPRKLFGTHNPFLSYYAELNNLKKDQNYLVNWEIYSSTGKFIRKGDAPVELKSSGNTVAVFDKVKIFYLKSGSYNFLLRLTDIAGKDSVYSANNFYIYRPLDFEKKVFATDSLNDMFDVLPDDKIAQEYSQLAAIFSNKEQELANKLNEKGQRGFLKKFWQAKEAKDPDARQKFLYLTEMAERDYTTLNTKGWSTDRGRILIKLGEPDKKDINIMTKDQADHEIWYYYNSNSQFVFSDSHGLGDYKLIHSDYPGEKKDLNWENKLKKRSKGKLDSNE